ncbi:MAG: amino acid-binding protein [Bacteroidales bacterium]|nr:amino acid-binding protein [Bacteroidales bacterium]
MTVNQLSIFIENKSGTLVKVLKLLKEEGIQLIASTIADTAEYGICRIICSEPARANDALKAAGVAVSLCEVFAIKLDDEPGRAADAIELFAREGISIAYLYSFLLGGKGVLVFRTDNAEKAAKVIKDSGLQYFAEKDLSKLV